MEEKDRKELEDLLIEAREKAVGAHLKKGNIKFLKFIAVIATLNFILFPFDYERVKPDLPSAMGLILFIQGAMLSGGSLLAAALAAVVKFAPWNYANRLARAFLLFYLIAISFVLLILIMNIARYRFNLF